jgi:hypothetical protein
VKRTTEVISLSSGTALKALRKPNTVRPSSVKVPVLSKTIFFTLPAILILYGAMQNILAFFSRATAKTAPQVKAAGIAGGTQIVNISSPLSIISGVLTPSLNIIGITQKNPIIARIAIIPTNLSPSV